jgi:hypothetical protein
VQEDDFVTYKQQKQEVLKNKMELEIKDGEKILHIELKNIMRYGDK